MNFTGIVLYGPPASGKSTVTTALNAIDRRFILFERLRVSETPKTGYRNISRSEADALSAQGQVVYENSRYGNRYIVDRAEIERLNSTDDLFPVLHLGQIEGVQAVMTSGSSRPHAPRWLTVQLHCARDTTLKRSHERGDIDTSNRAMAWDRTHEDLIRNTRFSFALSLDSDEMSTQDMAKQVSKAFFYHSIT